MKIIKTCVLLLFLFLSCFLIYTTYSNNNIYLTSLGLPISKIDNYQNTLKLKEYNTIYIDENYTINDLINILKYNEENNIGDKNISLHRILKKTDVLILSIGMNDLYSKLNKDTKDIYTYISNMTNNLESLLNSISKYDYKKVYVLGLYNIKNNNKDIFVYTNYKIKKLVKRYGYDYIDIDKLFENRIDLLEKSDDFTPNSLGYQQIQKIIVEKLKNN